MGTPEQKANIPYDALQLTVYTVADKDDGVRKPDTRGLMQISAAIELISHGLVKNVVIGGINFYSPKDGLRISQVYADALEDRLTHKGIKGINIIPQAGNMPKPDLKEGAKELGGEIDFLIDKANERGWKKVIALGYDQHLPRIAKLYSSRRVNIWSPWRGRFSVNIQSCNDILAQKHPHFTEKFEASPFRREEGDSFKNRERLKLLIMTIDRSGRSLTFLASRAPEFIKQRLAG